MATEKYLFDELDLELIGYIRDEVQKLIGSKASEAITSSGLYTLLQEDPIYVHHFDEKYWANFVLTNYEKKMNLKN